MVLYFGNINQDNGSLWHSTSKQATTKKSSKVCLTPKNKLFLKSLGLKVKKNE